MGIEEVKGQGVKLLWHYLYQVSHGFGVHSCLFYKAFGADIPQDIWGLMELENWKDLRGHP